MKLVAPLRYGVVFKKAFSEPMVFKGFVRDFLGVNLEIDKVETEKSFAKPIGNVASRFDLFAEDEKNRIIVDIQHVRYFDHYDRFLHYHCAALLEQAVTFNEYHPARTVFTLVVLTSGDKHKTDIAMIDFDPKNLQGVALREIPHKILYICPKYVNETTPEPYREWMLAIEDSLDGKVNESNYSRAEILRIFELIEEDTLSPEERARIIDEKRNDKYGNDKYNAGMEDGLKKAAQAMLTEGLELKLIMKFTGLTENELLNLQINLTGK